MIESFVIVLPLMLSPGPANLVSLALASRFGFSRILPFQFGILVIYAIEAVVLGSLAGHITGRFPFATVALQFLGGLFIAYLGIRLACRERPQRSSVESPKFVSGVVLQILNPKYPVVVLTVFADQADGSLLGISSIIVLVGGVGLLLYSSAGSLVRNLLPTSKYNRAVDMLFGSLLVAVGVWVVAKMFFK